MLYHLYNGDVPAADFVYEKGIIADYTPLVPALLPMQIAGASPEGFSQWLRERAIDLNTFIHRQLVHELVGSRDKTAVAIMTHMFSVSDTFTCFAEGDFVPRNQLCRGEEQDAVSDYILVSSDTSLRLRNIVTPNASTDGCFPKTWKFEKGAWWLYKLQSSDAVRSEREIGHALMEAGWPVAEYQYAGRARKCIKSRNFVREGAFFEPYDSLRFMFSDKRDEEQVIYRNIASLGQEFVKEYRRILLADALFMNTDRHMRNFGVLRSAKTGELLRMAPNFDNNQAYKANPSGRYSDAMLRDFEKTYGITDEDVSDLTALLEACAHRPYLLEVYTAGTQFLLSLV